jgi:hypothetical protein
MLVSGKVEGNITECNPELTSEGQSSQTQLDVSYGS